jgi:hypothetical protein
MIVLPTSMMVRAQRRMSAASVEVMASPKELVIVMETVLKRTTLATVIAPTIQTVMKFVMN